MVDGPKTFTRLKIDVFRQLDEGKSVKLILSFVGSFQLYNERK
tara:strand:+ start:431 stop:559 length:129 start_codon:yes stop_codon:yes gene_type:complete